MNEPPGALKRFRCLGCGRTIGLTDGSELLIEHVAILRGTWLRCLPCGAIRPWNPIKSLAVDNQNAGRAS